MKKISYMAMSALLVLGVASCKKNSDVQNPESKEGMVTTEFSAVSKEGGVRTSINGSDILWSKGDQIKIYAGTETTGNDFSIMMGVGTTSAKFAGMMPEAATAPYYAVYPSSLSQGIDGDNIKYNIPAEQAYVENSFATNTVPMAAYSASDMLLAFKNQTAFIKLQLTGAGIIKAMTLESASNNICGTFSVSKTDPTAASTAVEGAKKITVTNIEGTELDASEAINVIIAVAPATFAAEDLTISMTATDGKVFSTTLGGFNVGRSQGKAVAVEVMFAVPRPACQKALNADVNWVTIGTQRWLNVNTKCIEYDTNSEAFEAGITTIPTSSSEVYTPYYTDPTTASRPDYMSEEQFAKLGMLYNWAAAVGLKNGTSQQSAFTGNRQGICPNGSHVPSVTEWNTFRDNLGGKTVLGRKMKTITGWQTNPGTDDYGFAALPAGSANGSKVNNVGSYSYYWSSVAKSFNAESRYLSSFGDELFEYPYNKKTAYSVRCIKD